MNPACIRYSHSLETFFTPRGFVEGHGCTEQEEWGSGPMSSVGKKLERKRKAR